VDSSGDQSAGAMEVLVRGGHWQGSAKRAAAPARKGRVLAKRFALV
jgi:hypothetical protein